MERTMPGLRTRRNDMKTILLCSCLMLALCSCSSPHQPGTARSEAPIVGPEHYAPPYRIVIGVSDGEDAHPRQAMDAKIAKETWDETILNVLTNGNQFGG